jgi:hypothetical protein
MNRIETTEKTAWDLTTQGNIIGRENGRKEAKKIKYDIRLSFFLLFILCTAERPPPPPPPKKEVEITSTTNLEGHQQYIDVAGCFFIEITKKVLLKCRNKLPKLCEEYI